ncbi:hypothetical protein EST38_g7371, partial [Candolleomyces aberdarensis]
PAKRLKPLVPPALPAVAAPRKELRTISSTHIARSTDIQTGHGRAELASILSAAEPAPTIETRGIELSPEKRDKGKAKHVRSGLASCASNYFNYSNTSLSLWRKGMERHSTTPDMQARIIKVLVVPHPTLPISGVALCEIKSPYRTKELRKILFSFSSNQASQLHAFKPGLWVSIWKPWQTAKLSQADAEEPRNSLPLPASTQEVSIEDAMNLPVNDTMLICSKFIYAT